MKIIFFGIGSIAKKHIEILRKDKRNSLFSFKSKTNLKYVKKVNGYKEILQIKPDIAFITNPTSHHLKTLIDIHKFNMNIFVEKPITNNLKDFLIFKEKYKSYKKTIYVAYNQRFNPILNFLNVRYLKKTIPLSVNIICSSNLNNWRKKNSLKYYSAHKKKGGGVIYDLSHELDYVHLLFGKKIAKSKLIISKGKESNVTKDSDDYAYIHFKTRNGPIFIYLSYFTNRDERLIKIDFKNFTLVCDLLNERIIKFINNRKISEIKFKNSVKIMYEEQMKYFLTNIKKNIIIDNVKSSEYLIKNFF